ncbi:MAG: fused MFS/spermidine synthase [Planctomycetes bacterium]|nr:fused MFS/spermidine synthase [Planctomycetota bacterium]
MENKIKQPQKTSRRRLPLLVPCATVFISSCCIMVLELVAGRLIARHLGSSLYTWTSVIGVVLTGITLGNYFGGRLADRFHPRKTVAVLFTVASVGCVMIIVLNNLVGGWKWLWFLNFPLRVFLHVSLVFLLPSTLLGAISPVIAKMALDLGLATGRTIGSIYAWGAAGSIAGTFAAGYYFIAHMGTITIVWAVAAMLLVIAIFYWFRLWIMYIWLLLLVCASTMGLAPWSWAQEAGAAVALRRAPNPNIIYEDESQYCYISVNRAPGSRDIRDFVQDKLMHSRIDMGNILDLQYFYTNIYAAVTDKLSSGKEKLSVMVIGGGGYVYPRYIEKVWPGSNIDVVEIDPGVTEAAIVAFGLDRNTSIKTIPMDARNYVDGLLEHEGATGQKTRYDFIYEDAINDYSVPFQLTTHEFDEKIAQLLTDDGAYMVNLIDVFDDGLFLSAIINTLEKTFPHITVITEAGVPRSHRNTFVIIAAKQPFNLDDLYEESKKRGKVFWRLSESELQILREKTGGFILTDDYAPVENLLVPVVRRKNAYDLAEAYFKQANILFKQGRFDQSVGKYQKIVRKAPSMAIKAYNDMAVVFIKQGKWQQAADALKKCLTVISQERMDIYKGNIHYNLGVALSKLGELEGAAEQFNKAIADFKEELMYNPSKPAELHLKIGKSFASMGHIKEAEEYFSRALKLDPADVYHYLEMARNLELQQRLDEAIALLEEGVQFMSHRNRQNDVLQLENYLNRIKTAKTISH